MVVLAVAWVVAWAVAGQSVVVAVPQPIAVAVELLLAVELPLVAVVATMAVAAAATTVAHVLPFVIVCVVTVCLVTVVGKSCVEALTMVAILRALVRIRDVAVKATLRSILVAAAVVVAKSSTISQ